MKAIVRTFEWRPRGGDRGGYIFWKDVAAGVDSCWQAPAKFEGDVGGFKHGSNSFDWCASGDDYQKGDS